MTTMAIEPVTATTLTDPRWKAVLERDPASDGRFVYGVRTTGIYCRPTCPSRRPAPQHVSFFATPAGAERAGFRACRRCGPTAVRSRDAELAERVIRLIRSSGGSMPTLSTLARETGASPFHLQRTFKRITGVSPRQWAAARRVGTLKHRLQAGDTVSRAQYEAGFGSSSRLYESAGSMMGMTPATYRRGGAGTTIGYVVVATALGPLLVAGTERGVCAVRFGGSARALARSLKEEFPEAALVAGEPRVSRWAASLRAQTDGIKPDAMLPLDVQATAFQLRVWNELRRIPFGATRTYGEIARAIGRPRAARAVARAVASNRAALAIPCHRVVRGDGDVGGYRWGQNRKKKLLEAER
jgi:AraC family transcriptional regulator of adaptative response/methylated-DNA-[protein]-cysteine methyltransferase